ncbi:hypothetical protein EVAR_84426_1 [Eumeta japonica]|uniref:Uncharacterized protein n=1 Tax=Eumeta variegata TaxID=151549 RepID=A0A4C1W4A2_EUMVA|nr:hypothetical protein EVAR_84426_1 [Eumeta japonica]
MASEIAEAARVERPQMTLKYLCELLTFNGSHNGWLAFKSVYIDTASSFSKVNNTVRLRKALKGKAKDTVTHLLIANAEPSEIIRASETRFGRPDSIVLAELDRLKNILQPTDSLDIVCSQIA